MILLEVEQTGKPEVALSTEAGLIGLKGMNSVGLGMCVNGLVSTKDRFEPTCVPWFIILRSALNAENFARSLQAVLRAKRGVSGNVMFAQKEGEAIDLEVMPDDVGIVHDKDGILTHSNHFLTLTNRADFKDLFRDFIPNSLFRYHRARRLLAMDKGHIDVSSFRRVFSDHFSYPDSLCWHVNPKDDVHNHTKTLRSIIIDLTEGALYLTEGNPCENDYVKLIPFTDKAQAKKKVMV
jgi:isopenicillin-N N-acyltransferase-like protein